MVKHHQRHSKGVPAMAQLSMEERETVSQMWSAGHTRKAIAVRLGRAESTIGRELVRNGQKDGGYSAVAAQRKAVVRRRQRPLKRKLERPELNAAIRSRLTKEWSPDQIARRLKQDHPADKRVHAGPQTIYTWIDQDSHRDHWKTFLRRGGKPPQSPRSGQIPRQVKIDGRPEETNRRQRPGDFEGGTVVRRGERSRLVTLVQRETRYPFAAKLKDRPGPRAPRPAAT